MSIAVRVIQSHDATGRAAPLTFVQQIQPVKALQTWPDAVMAYIRPLYPSRTSSKGVYTFDDPERGSGELYVEGANQVQLLRIDELVHMEEIQRAIGMRDPRAQEDLKPYLVPLVIKSRNPYFELIFGSIGFVIGLCMLLAPLVLAGAPLYAAVVLPVIGTIGLIVGVLLTRRGMRRIRWWHAARAQARRDGGPMPEDIRFLG